VKLLLDANLSPEVARLLKEAGPPPVGTIGTTVGRDRGSGQQRSWIAANPGAEDVR
jgi:hypothetical protein